jgi:putative endonuclease
VSQDPPATPAPPPFYVYILQCSDGSYYVGYAEDVEARVLRHNEGRGSAWTRRRLPVTLAYAERFPDELSAMAREAQLKRWSAAKKSASITGAHTHHKYSSRCRTRWGTPARAPQTTPPAYSIGSR